MSFDLSKLNIGWRDNQILRATFENATMEFPRTVGNQLILCARMNGWDRFLAMLEIKTPEDQRESLKPLFSGLNNQALWKIKETFARLSTCDSD